MTSHYSEKTSKKVEKVMHEFKEGTLKSGSTGQRVKSRKQAIAIGLSEARQAGAKVPKSPSATSRSGSKVVRKAAAKRASTKAT